MKNYKDVEKLMKLSVRRTRADYAAAYEKVVAVFRFIDEQNCSNHCEILSILYEAKSRRLTFDGVATLLHISDNALRRYRKTYVKWFCYFLQTERAEVARACS